MDPLSPAVTAVFNYTRNVIESLYSSDSKAYHYLKRDVWDEADLFQECPRNINSLLEKYRENIEHNGN